MRYIIVLVGILLFATPLLAETPCDFKGISVGDKMPPAKIMAALGVTEYKTNPALDSKTMALVDKYGFGQREKSRIGRSGRTATAPHVPFPMALPLGTQQYPGHC